MINQHIATSIYVAVSGVAGRLCIKVANVLLGLGGRNLGLSRWFRPRCWGETEAEDQPGFEDVGGIQGYARIGQNRPFNPWAVGGSCQTMLECPGIVITAVVITLKCFEDWRRD